MASVITGKALTEPQYRALLSPALKIPNPTDLFDFQAGLYASFGIVVTSQEIGSLRNQLPNESDFFLLVPSVPRTADLPRILRECSKLVKDVQGSADPNLKLIESLVSDESIPKGAHLIFGIQDGNGAMQKNANSRMSHFKSTVRRPYTFWHMVVHALVYPSILNEFQVMAIGSIGPETSYGNKTSPVLCVANGGLQVTMRPWDDVVSDCVMPSFAKLVPAQATA